MMIKIKNQTPTIKINGHKIKTIKYNGQTLYTKN